MQYEIMKKLLPPGSAFGPEAKRLYGLLDGASKEFDRVKTLAFQVFTEIPGSLLHRLEGWSRVFGVSGDQVKQNREIAAKMIATGGQSYDYLKSVLKKYSSQPEKIEIVPDFGNHFIQIEGVEFDVNYLRAGSRAGRKVVVWKRNETLIKGFEIIKHAEVEARYYP